MTTTSNSFIYKVLRPEEWEMLEAGKLSTGSPVDVKDGYIHFSTSRQLRETVEKHFKDAGELFLAQLDYTQLGTALIWEPSRGGQLFAHLYGPLNRADVVAFWRLSRDSAGRYDYPEDLAE